MPGPIHTLRRRRVPAGGTRTILRLRRKGRRSVFFFALLSVSFVLDFASKEAGIYRAAARRAIGRIRRESVRASARGPSGDRLIRQSGSRTSNYEHR